jgi:phosphatidylserine/phosphatidylglycerophosphate/cardiolipin synthase-like enzyme
MRLNKYAIVYICAGFFISGLACEKKHADVSQTQIAAYFSPKGGCADAAIQVINGAKHSILIQAYSFTHSGIAEATAKAVESGKDVKVILDKSNLKDTYTVATFLDNHKVPLWIDSKHAIAHNKIIIVDYGTPDEVLITGSFNFTKQAETSNAENMLVIRNNHALVEQYHQNFQRHLEHSEQP